MTHISDSTKADLSKSKNTFDLDDLHRPHFVEHDASLSRGDITLDDDNHTFNPTIWKQTLSTSGDAEETTYELLSKGALGADCRVPESARRREWKFCMASRLCY